MFCSRKTGKKWESYGTRYDVGDKTYRVFVPVGKLANPEYLTFGRTDPATLAYGFETSRGFQ